MKRKRRGKMKIWRGRNEEGGRTKAGWRREGQEQEARRIQRGGVKGEGELRVMRMKKIGNGGGGQRGG